MTTLLNQIVSVKSLAGEEVIGRLKAEDAETLTIAKPISVQLQMVQQGGAAIAFAPFGLARDDAADFTFYKASLLGHPCLVRDDLRGNYLKATTGLDIPTSGTASSILRA